MSSTFIIQKSDGNKWLWMPNSTIFVRSINAIYHELESVDRRIASLVAQARDSDLSRIDISDWSERDFNILFKAIHRVETIVYQSIKERKKRPVNFIAIADLKLLLYFDTRYQGEDLFPYNGEIWIASDNIWHQAGWIFEHTINYFLSFALQNASQTDDVLPELIRAKTTHHLQLDQENDWNLQWYLSRIDTLKQWFFDSNQSLSIAPFMQKEYATAIADLNNRFWKTHQATIEKWLSEDSE